MGNDFSEVSDGAAEAVANVNAVGLPVEPAEGAVAAATVVAELQAADLGRGVVWVVDADEGCAQPTACVVSHLRKKEQDIT